MNYRNVFYQLGLLLLVLAAILSGIGVWVLLRMTLKMEVDEVALVAVFSTGAFTALLGGGLLLAMRRRDRYIGRREALLLVALSWIVGAAVTALPFYTWATLRGLDGGPEHEFQNFVNCYFESMSGLTTTGATILSEIQVLPRSLLLWRSLLHWMGGLGIVVLFVAVLPSLGAGGKRLFRVEATGPSPEGLQPGIRETARVLWFIYLGLTVAAILLFWLLTKMDLFDSVCHGFSMLSTGGLSTRDASIGYYDSVAADIICIVFMVLAGVNFAIYYLLTQGRWRTALRDAELRVYIALKVAVIIIVTLDLLGTQIVMTTGKTVSGDFWQALRFSSFVTIALHTGTGFTVADYDLWPYISRTLLVGLMFIGGCAGSTAGGIKVIRFWTGLKVLTAEIEKAFRPNVVRPIKVGGRTVDAEMKLSMVGYVVGFFLLMGVGAALIGLLERHTPEADLLTISTASLASIANVGPGMHGVGATANYGWFSDGSKIILALLMTLGRLEMFALIVLASPRFWRSA